MNISLHRMNFILNDSNYQLLSPCMHQLFRVALLPFRFTRFCYSNNAWRWGALMDKVFIYGTACTEIWTTRAQRDAFLFQLHHIPCIVFGPVNGSEECLKSPQVGELTVTLGLAMAWSSAAAPNHIAPPISFSSTSAPLSWNEFWTFWWIWIK